MIEIKDKQNCCGCTACTAICPKGCIEMKEDMEGFLYPVVDQRNCVNCGVCEKVCPTVKTKKRLDRRLILFKIRMKRCCKKVRQAGHLLQSQNM